MGVWTWGIRIVHGDKEYAPYDKPIWDWHEPWDAIMKSLRFMKKKKEIANFEK